MPAVSIIVPTSHQGCVYLKELLPDLLLEADSEIIIIDNKSEDQTLSFLERYKLHIKLIKNQANLGFSIANNQAAKIASGKFLLLLNNDTQIEPGIVAKFLSNFADEKIGAVGAKLVDMRFPFGCQTSGVNMRDDGYPLVNGHPDKTHPSVNQKKLFPFVCAGAMMIRRDLFLDIGGFHEAFINGWEDNLLCLKIYEKGYKILQDPSIEVRHVLHGSPGRMLFEERNVALYHLLGIETGLYKIAKEESTKPYPL